MDVRSQEEVTSEFDFTFGLNGADVSDTTGPAQNGTTGIMKQQEVAARARGKSELIHNHQDWNSNTGSFEADAALTRKERDELWARVNVKLRAKVGEDHYGSWFKGLALEDIADGVAYLSVSTLFLSHWIQNHYGDLVLSLVQEEIDDVTSMSVAVRGAVRNREARQPKRETITKALPCSVQENRIDESMVRRAAETESPYGGAPLDPKYTFGTFCVGQGNALACKAMRAIATGDRSVHFNPLFIHAKVGLGKTHLLQSIAWENIRAGQNRRVLYLTSERLMQKFREGFANKTIADIKEKLRDVDVMMIDDVQFLNGEKFQQEFSHLVNALIESGKQVIVSADRPAAELKMLDERVLSRLRGGVAFELEGPDRDLRRKILTSRLSSLSMSDPSITLPENVVEYIVQAVSTNGRDLEGALNRLVAQQCLTGSPVTLESAQLVLRDLVRADEPRKVLIEDIQRTVASHFNISKSDLVSQRRTRAIVRPRQIAMFLCKTMTPRSLPEIGKRFGGRDHTTVIHAVQKVEQLMKEDRNFSDDVELLKHLLND